MKPCAKNKKQIAWLAIEALEPRPAQILRAHLETCAGCRAYFEEMSSVTRQLAKSAATIPESETTEKFHRALTRRIEAEAGAGQGAWNSLKEIFAFRRLNWQVVGAIAVILILAAVFLRPSAPQSTKPLASQSVPVAAPHRSELTPSLGNYRILAGRSLDVLDQELTREANTSLAGTQSYTTFTMTEIMSAD